MWKDAWRELRSAKLMISIDESHLLDDRDGRYQRALTSVGRILATGESIGFRHFRRKDNYDICYMVAWKKEDYEDSGHYMVFRVYYSRQNHVSNEIGYRKFIAAEIACFYDGQHPNPGRTLHSRDDAIACMQQKDGYHECK
ncbi:MAG: hypothetical protein M3Q07_09620 [Pseudobdellovibrionaceae bacterium]|nr:hypothetical protein [Pseudobdellovibrionaceae bacterium]